MTTKKLLTLVFLRESDHILLGMKKRGFGVGKWNGFGGKVHDDESVVEGAIRELKEECGLEVAEEDLDKVGVVEFEFKDDPKILQVHVFQSSKFSGEMAESEEMRPRWFKLSDIPYEEMWLDDKYWYPHMIDGKKLNAHFLYEGFDKIIDYKIDIVDKL